MVRVNLWRDRRPFAIDCKRREAPCKFFDSYDKSEYDRWSEVIKINDQFEVDTELLGRLIIKVRENPYPGEQKRVLKVAVDLIPEGRWRAIFEDADFAFPRNFAQERIDFPVAVKEDVAEIERRLWELVREDNTVPANAVTAVIGKSANSKAYRSVKEQLQERKWRWGAKREEGKMVKVVFAPETA